MCLIVSILVSAMEKKVVPTDNKGRTPLHYIAQMDTHDINIDVTTLDRNKACEAARLIMQGADIAQEDVYGKTALYYSRLNQKKLPQVYAVMKAAHIRHSVESKIPKTKNGKIDEEELKKYSESNDVPSVPMINEWTNSHNLLVRYAYGLNN